MQSGQQDIMKCLRALIHTYRMACLNACMEKTFRRVTAVGKKAPSATQHAQNSSRQVLTQKAELLYSKSEDK